MRPAIDDDDDDSVASFESSGFSSSRESPSSTNEDTSSGNNHLRSGDQKIAQTESKFFLCSKFMAYMVLFMSAVAAGVVAYYFTREQETSEFEHDFKVFAGDIISAASQSALRQVEISDSVTTMLTSYALDRNLNFPFIALPDYEMRVAKTREMAGAQGVGWYPLVDESEREEWEAYSVRAAPKWIRESLDAMGQTTAPIPSIIPFIHNFEGEPLQSSYYTGDEILSGKYCVGWQGSPLREIGLLNGDILSSPITRGTVSSAITNKTPTVSPLVDYGSGVPFLFLTNPVFSNFSDTARVVGTVQGMSPVQSLLETILPNGVDGIDVVFDDSCGSVYTFQLNGPDVAILGQKDVHASAFNDMVVSWSFEEVAGPTSFFFLDSCVHQLQIYPTQKMKDRYTSERPVYYAVAVAIIFVFTAFVFLMYDWAVQLRQNKVLKTATRTQAIVSSLFPKNVQERIFKDVEQDVKNDEKNKSRFRGNRTKDQLRSFLNEGSSDTPHNTVTSLKSKPIADLFPEATVIFADLVGFTAWSSTREPTQVFTLLENIYHSFDEIAKRRRIFKVETVGDCYVAVSGLPEPRKDHAVAMARFSKDILHKFREMVKQMVVELGPDTEDLGLRVGLHSGPVTAGVLRGERARFQLFGDTMNTTARMESTGSPNRVQMSQETADLLIAAGKTQWITARSEKVNAKGKGELQTYWLDVHDDGTTKSTASATLSNTSVQEEAPSLPLTVSGGTAPTNSSKPATDKHIRLISWNTDILARLLTQIIARRESRGVIPEPIDEIRKLEEKVSRTRLVLTEVTEIVMLPKYEATDRNIDPSRIELSPDVVNQLRDYVQTLSAMYRENPFHNFEHASHVTMSVLKLLSRIVAPADLKTDTDKTLHDHTYGITSDPMTQFAVVLSALIHDADHPGVPNAQLIKENASIARVYNNKSIAEQNSVDLAWDLLMDEAYTDLRHAIYVTEEDFLRFRQLVVNIVLATDIMDKDLGALRKGRWNKAFSECPVDESPEVSQNRKATIVMEHLIQASDVAHTMQHWHIYRKWNQRLFLEMYKAFVEGRAEKNPADNWYEGEKGFFDFYIIPLAKKLKDCGVFGVSSDEYLQYAQQNRKEWELKGREVVAELLECAKERGFSKVVNSS